MCCSAAAMLDGDNFGGRFDLVFYSLSWEGEGKDGMSMFPRG